MPEKIASKEKDARENTYRMPFSEVIDKVTTICQENGVRRLELFGSFATGNCEMISNADKNAPQ